MKLSKFIDVIPMEGDYILCNSLNKSIIKMEAKYIEKLTEVDLNQLNKDDLNYLISNDFFETSNKHYIDKTINLNREFSTITINITETCNLECLYCYQNDFDYDNRISEKNIEIIFKYIENIINEGVEKLYIYFFGGEPLIYKKKILKIKKGIDIIGARNNIEILYGIGTNSSLIDPIFISNFSHLIVDTTLTLENDHNINRPLKNNGNSFRATYKNIKRISALNNVTLNIGYNTSHENIHQFEEFLKFLNKDKINCNVNCYYIDNYDFNPEYNNELSKKNFKKWASSTAIDLLIEHNFNINISPFHSFNFQCDAYDKWSIKFFSDGSIGVCNATNFYDRIFLEESDINLGAFYIQNKAKNNIEKYSKNNGKCLNCSLIGKCAGKIYCYDNQCNPNALIDYEEFIKTFVKQSELGNSNYFKL